MKTYSTSNNLLISLFSDIVLRSESPCLVVTAKIFMQTTLIILLPSCHRLYLHPLIWQTFFKFWHTIKLKRTGRRQTEITPYCYLKNAKKCKYIFYKKSETCSQRSKSSAKNAPMFSVTRISTLRLSPDGYGRRRRTTNAN